MRKYILAVITMLALSGCTPATKPVTPEVEEVDHSEDGAMFKNEYEEVNGQSTSNGKEYLTLDIPEENAMRYATLEDVMTLLDEGTGVIYFGFPTCPWCRNVVPVLLETAKEDGVETIYYFNASEYRDERRLNELGEIEIIQEAKEGYGELLNAFGEHASVYEGLGDETLKRLYFPTIVFVKEGQIIAFHEGSVSTQIDPFIPLEEEQVEELKKMFHAGMMQTFREVCTDKCQELTRQKKLADGG